MDTRVRHVATITTSRALRRDGLRQLNGRLYAAIANTGHCVMEAIQHDTTIDRHAIPNRAIGSNNRFAGVGNTRGHTVFVNSNNHGFIYHLLRLGAGQHNHNRDPFFAANSHGGDNTKSRRTIASRIANLWQLTIVGLSKGESRHNVRFFGPTSHTSLYRLQHRLIIFR